MGDGDINSYEALSEEFKKNIKEKRLIMSLI